MAHKAKGKGKKAAAEEFSTLGSIAEAETFAAWLGIDTTDANESVTPYTVLGLSAVVRSVSVISTTIAGLPMRAFERQGDSKVRMPSVFDDPYPGIEGMTPFAWRETVLIHLLLWRKAFLWHETLDSDGNPTSFRPLLPDLIDKVERVNGKYRFTYREDGEEKTVGTERITYIPGPSLDGVCGQSLLSAARAIFAGALAGDKAAAKTLQRGIRLAGILTPEEGEDVSETEGQTILADVRAKAVGRENAGDVILINRRVKLTPWQPTNVEMQWGETRQAVLGEMERLFGMPPHLLADIEKQTSWGTGIAEQNLGLARYTLRGWSDRLDQALTLRLPHGSQIPRDGAQFLETDYAGLLQGTPAQEIELLIAQVDAGLLTVDEARRIRNYPPLTPAQKAEQALRLPTAPKVSDPLTPPAQKVPA